MITPSDIENKEFSHAKRGYDEVEVDEYLDLIIVDMEKLIRENKQLKEQLEKAAIQVDKHMSTETTVYDTLESAKQLMNDIAASAEKRAEILLKNAELEADLIKHEAEESVVKLRKDSTNLKSRYDTMRAKYRAILESELERLTNNNDEFFEEFASDFAQLEEDVKSSNTESNVDFSKTMVISK